MRTSAPILWAEVEATNCGGATPRVHMAKCMAYASIAWARTTNIKMQVFRSVREGNESQLRRCHSACSYGSSASEERRSCLQRGKPLGRATGKALFISGVRWYFDLSMIGACILANESVSSSSLQACLTDGSLLLRFGRLL
jgi:hypothetical protein